jgi:gliding motility-associated-like protein
MKQLLLFITVFCITNYSYSQLIPDFTASPIEICVGEPIQFTDLSTSSGTITNWTWDFGDGSTSSLENPIHTYINPGVFTIILTVVDGNGAEPEVKPNFITVNPLPNPAFTPNVIGGCSLPSEVSINNVQPASGVSYAWDFGNGSTSTSGTPGNATYNSEGTFNIALTVTDNVTGCENTVVEAIDIFDFQADFSISTGTACAGSNVAFTDESSPGTNSWSWDFGDGSSSTNQNPTHSYSAGGTYTVTLTATNSMNGCSDTYNETIEVFPLPNPSFDFTPNSGCAPLGVDFTNTSNGNGTFEWDFGDGGVYSGENPPVYVYTSNGSYSVTLTQIDANGCSNALTQSNIINVSSITTEFEADVVEGCETLDVIFTDLSNSPNANDPITSWEWDFGNGTTFNGENPPAQSYTEGVYDVVLTVTTDDGCSQSDTMLAYISVGIEPNVDFSWDPPQDCAKSEFEFTNLTTISVPFDPSEVTYEWDFGDGGTSTDENPTYEYPQDTGYFDVQLIVNFRGCPDTMIYEDAVYIDAPIALFNVTSVYCNPTIPLDVTFNDEAIIGKETDNAEMIWDWGDGSSDVINPPDLYDDNPGPVTHTYNSLGTYTIQQVVHNYTTGCSDSITNTIYLSEIEALFIASSDSICVNDPVSFSNNGSNSTHPITQFSYNLGNNTTLNGANINYTYNTPGTYDITLTVSNSVGCQDSEVFSDLEVLALPLANISASDNAGCSPFTVTFTNNSVSQSGIPLSSFDWTFEDGSMQTTTNVGQTTNYTFTDEGIFQTQLIVTDEFGCVSPITTVQTELTKPTALFDIPTIVCNDEAFTSANNSIDYTSSEWFINNAAESTDNNLTTSLNHTGSLTDLSFTDSITLIVTDFNGCKDTLKQALIVSTPYADFDYVFSGANINDDGNYICPPVFTDLTDLSGSFGSLTNWDWDFGDGKASTLQNPNNTYVFAGTYSGSLIITDEFGCSDTMVYEDYLTIGGPSGDLEWVVSNQCEQEYTFTPSNLQGATDILWAMGNGDTISSIDAFNYAYSAAGTYIPTAILINADDCNISYILDTITVVVNPLNPYFEINPTTMNWGEPATISDYSSGGYGGIIDWSWEAGVDQFNNNGGTFDHLFNSSGEVVVTLVVTDTAGCKDAYEVIINVTDNLTIPNIVTPNGDGINDVFLLIDNVYKSYNVIILNRWGNVVSESFVIEDNYLWDGLNKSDKECVDGVYFYKIEGTQRDGEPRTEHGFLHLVR